MKAAYRIRNWKGVIRVGLSLSIAAAAVLFGGIVGVDAASIDGAGATFPAPLYQRWIETFLASRPQDQIRYKAMGSGEGLGRLVDGKVDFAGSDVCLIPDGNAAADFVCLPTIAAAVVPVVNLPGVSQDLRLTPETLAAIYLGKVQKWNDPMIRSSNHGVSLPDRAIVLMHRSDSSGSSYAWTEYLSKVSEEWKNSVGQSLEPKWPAGKGAEGNDGLAQAVQSSPYSMGYVELIYAVRHHLAIAMVRNSSGRFVEADLETITAAAAGATAEGGFSAEKPHTSLINAPAEKAYPIATFSWLIFPKRAADPEKRALLIQFLEWALTSGQRQAASLGYAAVPDAIAEQEKKVLATLP
jgi:phosphate transport system substrate-binding protein